MNYNERMNRNPRIKIEDKKIKSVFND